MHVLLIGGGGREHALCWKIRQSPQLSTLHAIPGSDAMARDGVRCPHIAMRDHVGIVAYAQDTGINLVVIGPEAPLVDGLSDALRAAGIPVFGPSQAAARLEGSKAFMKDLSIKYGIPTASYGRFTHAEEAKAYIDRKGVPIVVKADGLAAGKGVIIAHTIAQAHAAVDDMLQRKSFGDAGREIVVEEFLQGEEVSFFAISDGRVVLPMTSAQDHKAALDGDKGPNTGGMGAYSPARIMTPELDRRVMATIIEPTVRAMEREGCPFQGVLFAGLMMIKRRDGTLDAKLLEFNVRFGDPECQALMLRMESDILPLLKSCADGKLEGTGQAMRWRDEAALCVVMASPGYPDDPRSGQTIKIPGTQSGPLTPARLPVEGVIFHAGTKAEGDNWTNTGGRVLGCTALGATVTEAQGKAYALVATVDWPDGYCRKDIGWRAVAAEAGEK